MSAREVITIQCGHFSNFIGTHWWNIQVVSWTAMTESRKPDPLQVGRACETTMTVRRVAFGRSYMSYQITAWRQSTAAGAFCWLAMFLPLCYIYDI